MFTRSDNLRSHAREKHGVDWGRIRREEDREEDQGEDGVEMDLDG